MGLAAKAFAMRLMHLGLPVFVAGETTRASEIARGDLLIIGSGCGHTVSLVGMAEKAKVLGASVALVTTFPRVAHRGSSRRGGGNPGADAEGQAPAR